MERRDPPFDAGHALVGPIAARRGPGMVPEIGTDVIEPGDWGWTRSGGWSSPVNDRLGVADGKEHMLVWAIDARNGIARDQNGREVTIRPFMGVIGMPPAEAGIHSTIPPRACGGNLDLKELVAGSACSPDPGGGAKLSARRHAAVPLGEVSGLAIECPMNHVT